MNSFLALQVVLGWIFNDALSVDNRMINEYGAVDGICRENLKYSEKTRPNATLPTILKMKPVYPCETSVSSYKTAWRHSRENSSLPTLLFLPSHDCTRVFSKERFHLLLKQKYVINFFLLKIKLCIKMGLIGKSRKLELKPLRRFHIVHTIPPVLISQESNKTLPLFSSSFYFVKTAVFVSPTPPLPFAIFLFLSVRKNFVEKSQ